MKFVIEAIFNALPHDQATLDAAGPDSARLETYTLVCHSAQNTEKNLADLLQNGTRVREGDTLLILPPSQLIRIVVTPPLPY
jgi:hypothetical protein